LPTTNLFQDLDGLWMVKELENEEFCIFVQNTRIMHDVWQGCATSGREAEVLWPAERTRFWKGRGRWGTVGLGHSRLFWFIRNVENVEL